MAADPAIELARLYREAMLELKQRAVQVLVRDRRKLTAEARRARLLEREIAAILAELDAASATWIAENIPSAYMQGIRETNRELSALGAADLSGIAVSPAIHQHAVQVLVDDMQDVLADASNQIVKNGRRVLRRMQVERELDRQITRELALGVAEGKARREVSEAVAERLISEFGDAPLQIGGRRFSADAYAELVARTKTREAATAGTVRRMVEVGNDLVQVSAHGAKDGCGFYEGRVFSISGTSEKYPGLGELPNSGPPFHPNSHVAGTVIDGLTVVAASSREFEGEVVTIQTAAGNQTTITANHPIATGRGFVPAKLVEVGDCVFRSFRSGPVSFAADHERGPTEVSKLVELCDESGKFVGVTIPVRTEDFHGEGKEGQVAVVRLNREFLDKQFTETLQTQEENAVVVAAGLAHAGHRGFSSSVLGMHRSEAVHGDVGVPGARHSRNAGGTASTACLDGDAGLVDAPRSAAIPAADAALPQSTMDKAATDAEYLGNLCRAYPGLIESDGVVKVTISEFSGHVYCLQSLSGLYTADGILVHNCVHVLLPFIEDLASERDIERAVGVPKRALGKSFPEVNKLVA